MATDTTTDTDTDSGELTPEEIAAAKAARKKSTTPKKTSAALVTDEAQTAKEIADLKKKVANYDSARDEDRTVLADLHRSFEELTKKLTSAPDQKKKGFFESLEDDLKKFFE